MWLREALHCGWYVFSEILGVETRPWNLVDVVGVSVALDSTRPIRLSPLSQKFLFIAFFFLTVVASLAWLHKRRL